MCSLSVLAEPAKPGWHTITQSDGTTLQVRAVGDEFYSVLLTSDDLMVARGEDGDFYYKTATGLTTMKAHEPAWRSAAENSFISAQQDNLKWQANSGRLRRSGTLITASGSNAGASVPATGSRRIPVILVQFQDKSFSNTRQQIINSMITGDKGVETYFRDQSNGNYQPTFDVYGIYTLSHNREYYGAHDDANDNNDQRLGEMVTEACQLAAANNVRFSTYDTNNDDSCDVVLIIYAGIGESQASATHPETIWPCHWTLSGALNHHAGGNGPFRPSANDPVVNHFAVFNEVKGSDDSNTRINGIGTFAHEFSHCLGLPDMYDVDHNGHYGLGHWDLMSSGNYNDDGYTPPGYSAYEKVFMGWVNYITPQQNTHYNLPVWNKKSSVTDQAIRIVSDKNSNEYFILENRQKQGWDEYLPGEGILITHVVYVPSRWRDNKLNNEDIQLLTIMSADAIRSFYNEETDTWPWNDRTDFTNTSTPSARLNLTANGNVVTSAGLLGKPVVNMSIIGNGTASLWYMPEDIPINSTNFPDANFRNYVLSLYPNGYLTYKDIRSRTMLDVSGKNISNLKGIGFFTDLESLNCSDNRITSLDLNNNIKLIDLFCQDNTSLKSLIVTNCAVLERLNCSNTSITSLYVLSCANLRNLICENTKLTSLTVTGISTLKNISCSNTTTLKTLNCFNNGSNFTHLYFSGCTGLETLSCYANANLHTLYGLADCTALTYLDCGNCSVADLSGLANLSNLEKVYASNNKLKILELTSKSKLSTLHVMGNTTLTELRCFRNALTSLDVTGCTALKSMHCYDNPNLAAITGLADCKAIAYLDCEDCAITSLNGVSGMNDIETLYARNNKITSLSISGKSKLNTLRLAGNTLLVSLYCYNNNALSFVSVAGCTALKTLSCYDNASLMSITGLADCKAMTTLSCNGCALTSLSALKGMTKLASLYCQNNKLTSLNVTNCTALTTLKCYNNPNLAVITGLADCTAITYLDCEDCSITDLSAVQSMTSIITFLARNNQLSGEFNLKNKSQLVIVRLNGNSGLTRINCINNPLLLNLDVSSCTGLTILSCFSNALTSLNLNGCSSLNEISCRENRLEHLSFEGCTSLKKVYCYKNKFTETGMNDLISTLPTRTAANRGELCVVYNTGETNVFTNANAAAAAAKYWAPMRYNGSTWVEMTFSLSGDVNGDGQVDIRDVTALIDYLLTGNASGINLVAADVNSDGGVNIGDVAYLIDLLLTS